jgi:hypothetical protein
MARNARSATEIKWSKGCPDSIIVIISKPAEGLRRGFALGDLLDYTSRPFFDPPFSGLIL